MNKTCTTAEILLRAVQATPRRTGRKWKSDLHPWHPDRDQ